jgi:hypothetical protein
MIITKKAAAGFLLLAVIVFLTAYYSPEPQLPETKGVPEFNAPQPAELDNRGVLVERKTVTYRPPLIPFDDPVQRAAAITIALEAFTLICYLGLKKFEARIEEQARIFVESVRDAPQQE